MDVVPLSPPHTPTLSPPVPTFFYYSRGINKEISSSFIDELAIVAKCMPLPPLLMLLWFRQKILRLIVD